MSGIIKIVRKYDPQGSCGKVYDGDGYFCRSLERQDFGNRPDNPKTKANDSSCIPEGEYEVIRDKTGKFQYFSVQNVPGRKNIECHPANSIDDLLGCIAFGEDIEENKYGYKFWLTKSRVTCDALKAKYPDGFKLIITSENSECSVNKL